jgi:NAD(P)-dependent dehydrogenase (short-subunit alcohol dehydrogenase family)
MASPRLRLRHLSQILQRENRSTCASGEDHRAPVCLVVGGGRGIGGNVARRFAQQGFTACVVLRSNAESMQEVLNWIRADGNAAHGFLADATNEHELSALIADIERDIGPIHVAVYNLNAFVARTLDQTTTEIFDTASQLGSRGAFLLAQTVTPYMLQRPPSTMQSLFFTSAASALRGNATQSAHAAGLFGRRAIAQALSHELWPLGIHVATINVDGPVNSVQKLPQHQFIHVKSAWHRVCYASRTRITATG